MTAGKTKSDVLEALVLLISLAIAVILGAAAWDMNPWPTDTEAYYMPAAIQLNFLQHVSQIHADLDSTRVRWLHGKEALVVLGAAFQRFLKDYLSLRPFLLLCLCSVFISSLLIFVLGRRWWGTTVGLVLYFLFSFSMWPYLYVLFTKHQPVGLMFFLLSVWCLHGNPFTLAGLGAGFISGVFLGMAFFSSPVAPLYAPYALAAFLYILGKWGTGRKANAWGWVLGGGVCVATGIFAVAAYFNYPQILYNLKLYWEYVKISGDFNHFYYNQPYLQQWFPFLPVQGTRGGWPWIWKYCWVTMPVLFPVYLAAAGYLLAGLGKKSDANAKILTLGLILLSASPLILAEFKHVAQYGANYFPFLVGMLLLIGYSLARFLSSDSFQKAPRPVRRTWIMLGAGILLAHSAFNAYAFWTDLYPCRMATTFLSRKIKELGIRRIHVYGLHPLHQYMEEVLDADLRKDLEFVPAQTILKAPDGYFLIPPVTGDNIYLAMTSHYHDYDQDLAVNELMRTGKIRDYAVASFKTLASSRYWGLEEEILAYRQLLLGSSLECNPDKQKVWILDVNKFRRDAPARTLVDSDDVWLMQNNVRNIGVKTRRYMFAGERKMIMTEGSLDGVQAKVYRVGRPLDSLVAYLYKIDKEQPVWVPAGEHFAAVPVAAKDIPGEPSGQPVDFRFPEPLPIAPGAYLMLLYRTGAPDDANYYRISVER